MDSEEEQFQKFEADCLRRYQEAIALKRDQKFNLKEQMIQAYLNWLVKEVEPLMRDKDIKKLYELMAILEKKHKMADAAIMTEDQFNKYWLGDYHLYRNELLKYL
jgi:transposase